MEDQNITRARGCSTLMTGALGAYVAASVAINVALSPLYLAANGIERLLDWEISEQQMTVVEKHLERGLQSKAKYGFLTLETPQGERITVADRYDFLEGKFLPHSFYKNMQEEEQYVVKFSRSSFGNNILSAKKLE